MSPPIELPLAGEGTLFRCLVKGFDDLLLLSAGERSIVMSMCVSSMQIAGLETRGSGTCGTGTAVLGHAELGQRFWDSFYSVKMGKIVVCCDSFVSCGSR